MELIELLKALSALEAAVGGGGLVTVLVVAGYLAATHKKRAEKYRKDGFSDGIKAGLEQAKQTALQHDFEDMEAAMEGRLKAIEGTIKDGFGEIKSDFRAFRHDLIEIEKWRAIADHRITTLELTVGITPGGGTRKENGK